VLIQKGSLSQSLQNGLLQAKAFEEKKFQGYSSQLAKQGRQWWLVSQCRLAGPCQKGHPDLMQCDLELREKEK
jgi:hypothetical protein